LPYIEGKALYERYNFDEPWDSPNNRLLANEMPDAFRCPSDALGVRTTSTSYVAVVGPETTWPGSQPMSLDTISDGWSKTILLVEVANSGIDWMEPRDLPFSSIHAGINPKQGLGPSSKHPGSITVAFADGSARSIQTSIPQDVFEALLTSSGGETIPGDY
jgi:prepilin-type processing-associated H-X9-DG protein